MPHRIADCVAEQSSSAGTGNFTFSGSGIAGGFGHFSALLTANGDTTWYVATDGVNREVGLMARVSATSYARTTILMSSNGGSVVNFASAPVVYCDMPAAALMMSHWPAFKAFKSVVQNPSNATYQKVVYQSEEFDTNSCFDSATNYRFTPNWPGIYRLEASILLSGSSLTALAGTIRKNGVEALHGNYNTPVASADARVVISGLVEANGTTDYFEVFAYCAGSTRNLAVGATNNHFSGSLIRPA